MTMNIESVEIILESESTSKSPGIPVLALNAMCVIQVFEWTGDVSLYLHMTVVNLMKNDNFCLLFCSFL